MLESLRKLLDESPFATVFIIFLASNAVIQIVQAICEAIGR